MSANLSKSQIFLFSCLSFIFGIAIASFLPEKILQYDLWIFGVIVGLGIIIISIKQINVSRYVYFLFILFFLFGIWRYSISIPQNTIDKIWHYSRQNVEFIGVVNKEPDVRIYNTKLTVAVESLENVPVSGNVLITTKLFPEYNYGDKLKIKCKLEQPEQIQEFAYDRYLARHKIFSVCYYPQISHIETRHGVSLQNVIYSQILNLKNKLKENINFGLVEPEASLLQAIILGNKRGLTPELINQFSQAGVSHMVAISGMHIAIISVIILNLLLAFGLSRRQSFFFASTALLIYIILIGMPASAMRAGLMAFMAMLAIYLGRLNKLTNSLVLIAGILLLFNPRLLRDDIGFQLSFMAVLSIVYIKPVIDLFYKKFIETKNTPSILKGIWDIVSVTLAAQVLTLPIIALNFHQVSIIAPIVNLLILPLLPFIMISGMLAAILSLLFFSFAWLFFMPAYFLLKYLLWMVDFSVKLPLAYIEVEYIWIGWVVLFYAVVGYAIMKITNSKKQIANKS